MLRTDDRGKNKRNNRLFVVHTVLLSPITRGRVRGGGGTRDSVLVPTMLSPLPPGWRRDDRARWSKTEESN